MQEIEELEREQQLEIDVIKIDQEKEIIGFEKSNKIWREFLVIS